MWLCKTMMVIETMDVYMSKVLKVGPYVPMRTITKTRKEPVTIWDHIHEWNEEEKKKVNLGVQVRATICGALSYNVYYLVENCLLAKDIIHTLKVAYEGTVEVKAT